MWAEIGEDWPTLVWMNRKPFKENKWPRRVLTLFGLGIMHILCLLIFPRQAKTMLEDER